MFSLLRSRTVKKRVIVVGLKDDNSSREVLLRLLNMVVMVGDSVLAVHVQERDGCEFDPNTFYIHEDLCKSKQVDFQVKVCTGSSYMVALSHQVRTNFATILALGCSNFLPQDSKVSKCLKTLPPTCTLLVMDSSGRILVQMAGTSQEGSSSTEKVLRSSLSSPSKSTLSNQSARKVHQVKKSVSMPVSLASPSNIQTGKSENCKMQSFMSQKLFQRLAALDIKGSGRRFSTEQLKHATNNFDPGFLIGEGGYSMVYRAKLENDQAVAVKVLKAMKKSSEDFFFREVEILSSLNHENIVGLIGYCYSQDMQAVVCNLLECSLKQRLNQLEWSDRMRVAIHVAKALDYLHSLSPPIIHRDVKSSNILLSHDCQPQLSDFGAATVHEQTQKISTRQRPFDVVGTFGYMAPEYMMYGRVDEKIDVYSYGVVLLELITGKPAIQTNQASQHESLVLWEKSLHDSSLCECLIGPFLDEDYDKDEMATMITVARLCLLDPSSSRPTMKMEAIILPPFVAIAVRPRPGECGAVRRLSISSVQGSTCKRAVMMLNDRIRSVSRLESALTKAEDFLSKQVPDAPFSQFEYVTEHGILRKWISRFDIWPYLENFTEDAASEICAELQGNPDLIIGNYSDGNLVASLLSYKMGVTQCTSVPLLMHWKRQNILIRTYIGKSLTKNIISRVNLLLI